MESSKKYFGTIAVVGANGKMGREVTKKLKAAFPHLRVAKILSEGKLQYQKQLRLVIDFATGKSSAGSSEFCAEHAVPLIIGSTGQTIAEMSAIRKASERVPIVKAGNFSIGVECLKGILKLVSHLPASDIVILEKHHKQKKDSPSGTALELAAIVEQEFKKTPAVLSERGGEEIGTHTIDIYFGKEKLTLSHQAFSREAFVNGVVIATKVMLSDLSPKLYNFTEILQIYQNNIEI